MSLVENIGPLLGLIAFIGFIGFLVVFFQQAREVRRLRDWAGRAPERAAAAAEREERVAALAKAERQGDQSLFDRVRIDPLVLGAGLGALLIAAAIFTNGFGVLNEDSGSKKQAKQERRDQKNAAGDDAAAKPTVVVLNATQPGVGLAGTAGVADRVSAEIPGGTYKIGDPSDAPEGLASSTIMFTTGNEEAATSLADSLLDLLGRTLTEPMTPEIQAAAGKNADLVVVIGLDDASIVDTPAL